MTQVDVELRPLLGAERFMEATTLVLRTLGPGYGVAAAVVCLDVFHEDRLLVKIFCNWFVFDMT